MVPIEMTELRQKKCSCRQRCDRISVHTEQAETVGRHVRDRWLFIKDTRAPGIRKTARITMSAHISDHCFLPKDFQF